MKAKCRGYEGDLIRLEKSYELKSVYDTLKIYYSISIKVNPDTTVDIDNVYDEDIFIENKKDG